MCLFHWTLNRQPTHLQKLQKKLKERNIEVESYRNVSRSFGIPASLSRPGILAWKWAWDQPEGGCQPVIESQERANISAHDTCLIFVFSSWYSGCFLQSCFFLVCHVPILVDRTRSILFAHCAFDGSLSPPRFPAHWLPFPSFLICLLSCFGLCLLTVVWKDFFATHFKWALLFIFFPRAAPNHPILQSAHLFQELLLIWFRSTFPYNHGRSIILFPQS